MRRAGLRGVLGRPKFRRVPNVAAAADLVDRDFARPQADRLSAADVTEHPTREGKGLLRCGVGAPSAAVSWVGRVDSRPAASMAANALGMAIDSRGPVAGETVTPQRPPHPVRLLGVHPASDRFGVSAIDGLGRGLP